MPFKRAVKHEAKLRLAIAGPSGSGKTYSALAIATYLVPNGRIAVIDTENGSASKYADIFTFDVLELKTFHPDRYIEAINEAAREGYDVVIIDSASPAWNGVGGLLELHEQITKRNKGGNSYTAWADVTPIHNRFTAAITGAPMHLIATMRSKTEYVIETANGKSVPKKHGMAPIQREGIEYEFDIFGELTQDHDLLIQKTRCPDLADAVLNRPGKDIADTLRAWLSGEPAPAKAEERQETHPAAPSEDSKWIKAWLADHHINRETLGRYLTDVRIDPMNAAEVHKALELPATTCAVWALEHGVAVNSMLTFIDREHLDGWPALWAAITNNEEDMLIALKDMVHPAPATTEKPQPRRRSTTSQWETICQYGRLLKVEVKEPTYYDEADARIAELKTQYESQPEAPAEQQPPASTEPMASDRQLTSIRMLSTKLNRPEPDPTTLTFSAARDLLAKLSKEYGDARKATA